MDVELGAVAASERSELKSSKRDKFNGPLDRCVRLDDIDNEWVTVHSEIEPRKMTIEAMYSVVFSKAPNVLQFVDDLFRFS